MGCRLISFVSLIEQLQLDMCDLPEWDWVHSMSVNATDVASTVASLTSNSFGEQITSLAAVRFSNPVATGSWGTWLVLVKLSSASLFQSTGGFGGEGASVVEKDGGS